MTMQEAMQFLQGDMEPGDVREQMIVNNRSALSFAGSNLFHPIDEEYFRMLAMILTQNMDGGGREYRGTDWVDIPSMMGEPYEVPPASEIPDRVKEITGFLADHTVHPLIKASAAQAWVLAVRPFREGNERLARLLSNVVLVRAGYTFFGEISLSGLIARNGYPYYNAAANIMRAENGGDLTYFLEYYVVLLSQAVEERRRRKKKQEEENRKAEEELARTALQALQTAPEQPQTPPSQSQPGEGEAPNESVGADPGPSPPEKDTTSVGVLVPGTVREKAMLSLQEKYDVTISLGRITYGDERFSARVTVVNGRDPEIVARNKFDADVWKYEHLGLLPGMYNRIFRGEDGKLYAIQGFNTKAKKWPIITKRVSDGESRVCNERFIKEILNEYYTEAIVSE
ncbi:MAG: Fic family protein [Lachnospiraceae bacterium]|nr:Fic family protein [Lachnospiraceae bacterium]